MAKTKMVKRSTKTTVATVARLVDQFKIQNPNAEMVTVETVADKKHNRFVGRYSCKRVSDFQNFVFECNVTDMLTNDEIVDVLTIEHPQSSAVVANGGTFPIDHIDGMRTLYNRGAHGNKMPTTLSPKFEISKNGERFIDEKWKTKNQPSTK